MAGGGWWWGSQPSPSSEKPGNPIMSTPATPTDNTSTTPLSRDEQSLADLRNLFASIDPERAAAATAAVKDKAEKRANAAADEDDDPESLYPATMKCSSCFDQAYYCSSLGGQMTNIYRYGGMRSCSDLWAQWRFCMRTKAMGAEEKKERIREWEQRKVVKYKLGRSSEDVWHVRDVPVERPFSKDYDVQDVDDVILNGQC